MNTDRNIKECKANVIEFLNNATDAEVLAFINSPPFQQSQGMLIIRKVLIVWVGAAKEPKNEEAT